MANLEKICDAFEITIAQFFSDDESRLDLTKEQKEILEIWERNFYDFYPQPEEVMDSSTKMRAIFFI